MIYLDHAASTPCDPRVVEAMLPWFSDQHANASSPHRAGLRAKRAVDRAREQVAAALGVSAKRVVFTSGATEALNAAYGIAAAVTPSGRRVVVGATEHKASLEASSRIAQTYDRPFVTVGPIDGLIEPDGLVLRSQDVAGFMAVNNETGAVTDVPSVCGLARDSDAVTVVDLTQAVGRSLIDATGWQIDLGAASAHKIGGPQGVGALVLPERRVDAWAPLLVGGGQERGLRAGTSNVPAIVGFGVAAELAVAEQQQRTRAVAAVAEGFLAALAARVPDAAVNGRPGVPHIVNVWLPGIDNSIVLARCPDVAVATGSACNSAVPEPSHVLLAHGYAADRARESIRVSFSHTTTIEDATRAAAAIARAVLDVRSSEAR